MEENIAVAMGFIMGNKQRERVVQVLGSKGALSSERIAKIEHIPAPGVKRILDELSQKQIVTENGGLWSLTNHGLEVEKETKKRT